MGVLLLQLPQGWHPESMQVLPGDVIEVDWNLAMLKPRCDVVVRLRRAARLVRL
jgi:hypothetical protein